MAGRPHAPIPALALLLALLAWAGGASGSEAPPPRTAVVVLENHEYGEVIGDARAPYLNRLARRGALATRYYAVTHPSLPNYLAIAGGSTFGVTDNCGECRARGRSLAGQLSEAGIPWRAYMEGLPRACFPGDRHGDYVKRHDPFMYFPEIADHRSRCRRVVPAARLERDLAHGALPAFAWLSPDLCNDGHDCGIGAADRAMAKLLPRLRRRLGQRGLLIVTFDEGTTGSGCCGVPGGGRVATLLVGPGVPAGTRIGARLTHYSLLAALEDRYGLDRLRHARGARPLPTRFAAAAVK